MTYNALLDEENIKSNYLVILRPRRRVLSFILVSGSIYKASFTYGDVYSVRADGLELSEALSTSLLADEWFYDDVAQELYVRLTSGNDPDTVYLVATYNLYCGTNDSHWYADPLDDTSKPVYFDAVVSKSPVIKISNSDVLNGYMPVQSTSISLNNSEHWLDVHLYDSSFSQAQILVYHWLDELTVANLKIVMNGICNNVDMKDPEVDITIKDRVDIFQQEYRHDSGDQFFTTATFPNLSDIDENSDIRAVFGRVDNMVPTNIDYVNDNPSTSDNRDWVVMNGQTGLSELTSTVPASPSSTTTRTYLANASGFNIGDHVWFDRVIGGDEYKILTDVNLVSNYLEHAALGSPMATGDTLRRGCIGNVYIIQNEVLYPVMYGRDYTIASFAGNTTGFSLSTSMEANLSMPETLTPFSTIYCRAYGRTNYLTLGGTAFGSDNAKTKNMALVAQVVLDLLKRVLGVSESDIDSASFTTALTKATYPIGFAVPESKSGGFPEIRTILTTILNSGLMSLIINEDAKWELVFTEPFGTEDLSIDETEIIDGSLSFGFDTNDICSELILNYAKKEASTDPSKILELGNQFVVTNNRAKYVHGIQKSKTVDSYVIYLEDADVLATRLAYFFGERSGDLNFKAANKMFRAKVGDVVMVSRSIMPGYNYDQTTLQSRKYKITEINKGLRQVTIKTLDFKGIEDNSGSW